MRDPYSVLGVKNSAGPDEIKAAWRSLAKAVHPDTNRDDPSAHARFAEVGKAYDILKDPARRSRYDLEQRLRDAKRKQGAAEQKSTGKADARNSGANVHGASGKSSSFSFGSAGADTGGTSARQAADEQQSETESAEDIISRIFGSAGAKANKSTFATDAAMDDERQSDGSGLFSAAEIFASLLKKFRGNSTLPDKAPDLLVDAPVTIEALFEQAKATATLPDGKSIKVALPKGIVDGQSVRLPELGFRFPGMARGDVVATVRIQKHPLFQAEGHDLRTVVPVDIENAVLGCETTVDTPNGLVKIDVPAWSGSDRVLVLNGHGLPKPDGSRGDLLIELRLMLWDHPDSKVTDLMRSLREGLFV